MCTPISMEQALRTIHRGCNAEPAARALKHRAEADPESLQPHGDELLRLALAADDLRVRWNLVVVLGLVPLAPAQRSAATDWLWERLDDASPLTRTLALQSLVDLSGKDPALRRRLRPIAEQFLEHGTAAMRARARRLLTFL